MSMNTANKLTLLRVFLIPVFLVVFYWGFPGSRYVALGIYAVACLTDLLDGYIARHYNQVSDFGKFADPLADKCLVMAALCCFVQSGEFYGWNLAVVLVREFAVSGMRLLYRGGLTIYATQDSELQAICEEEINRDSWYSSDAQASVVVMDPATGQVKAIVGGRGEKDGSLTFNRAVSSRASRTSSRSSR